MPELDSKEGGETGSGIVVRVNDRVPSIWISAVEIVTLGDGVYVWFEDTCTSTRGTTAYLEMGMGRIEMGI